MATYMPWLLLLSGVPAWACSCGAYPSAKDAWADSPVVFLGRVEKTEQQTFSDGRGITYIGEQKARVVVQEAFKGTKTGDRLSLKQPGSMCAPKFTEGEHMVFYLHPAKADGAWEATGCHRTRPLRNATDDLLFLRALPWAAERTRLSGEVHLTGFSADGDSPKSTLLPGARVLVRSAGRLVETVTDGQGVFELYDLLAGSYEVEIEPPKGYRVGFPSVTGVEQRARATSVATFLLSAGRGVSVDFSVVEDNALAGRVVGPEGQALRDVCVYAIPVTATNGQTYRWPSCSKDNGEFRIEDAPAGSYRLVVNRDEKPTGKKPFGQLYYPGVAAFEKAEVLEIKSGEQRERLEFRIPRFERVVNVSGRVQFSDGWPAAGVNLWVVEGGDRQTSYQAKAADGKFQLPLLAGAAVRLEAELVIYNPSILQACAEFAAASVSKGIGAIFKSQQVTIEADKDETGIVLTLPVKSCRVP